MQDKSREVRRAEKELHEKLPLFIKATAEHYEAIMGVALDMGIMATNSAYALNISLRLATITTYLQVSAQLHGQMLEEANTLLNNLGPEGR